MLIAKTRQINHMPKLIYLTKKQTLLITGYSLIYPLITLTTALYDNILPLTNNFFVHLGILLTFPLRNL